MYQTSYSASNGQPYSAVQQHKTLDSALEAWRSNIGGLIAGSGGQSLLVDVDDDEPGQLSWVEYPDGGCVSAGERWAWKIEYSEDHPTPDVVVNLLWPTDAEIDAELLED